MKKALNILSTILVWILVVATLCVVIFTFVSVRTFDNANRSIFGYKFFIVRSDSMSATDFSAGDIVLVKNCDPATLQVGDIIAYTSQNPNNYGDTVTHKIRSKTVDSYGNPAFVTYGTTTDTDDETPVAYAYILGKYDGKIPKVGMFFQFLKTTPGYILCIFIPFLLLIAYQGINCIKIFRQYRREQLEELRLEREKIEEERRQAMEMMKELQSLKEQLLAAKDNEKSDK